MEEFLAFLILVALIPLLLTIGRVFAKTDTRRRWLIILNLLVWCYEIFFFIAVCGGLPNASVNFGGGLGDLLFVFALIVLMLAHIIALSIMSYRTSQAVLFLIPLAVVAFPLVGMHGTAARGDEHNGYMTGGNSTGLYYNAKAYSERIERQREAEALSKPQEPKFATEFEFLLYYAERGDIETQNSLGCRYAKGEGVEKNDSLAVKWFRSSAEGGSMIGGFNLGVCYYHGKDDLSVDYLEAVKWFRKAAEEGYDDAQYMLGRCYGFGEGLEQDDEQAYNWLRLAARQDHKDAQELLKENGKTW